MNSPGNEVHEKHQEPETNELLDSSLHDATCQQRWLNSLKLGVQLEDSPTINLRLWGIHQILELARGQRNQENQLAEVLVKVEGLVLSLGPKVDNSQPVGGQDKQESQVAELSERLSKVEGVVVDLGIKVDQVIHRISRLDVLNDEFGKSVKDVVEVAKAVNAMGQLLAKSLHKEASPTGSDQNPPSKRRKV